MNSAVGGPAPVELWNASEGAFSKDIAMQFFKKGITFLLENSLFLILGTVLALVLANTDHEFYEKIIETGVQGHGGHHYNFHFLVNDVLMTLFFALAAKEIWEALLPGGALSSPKKAATPLLATAGGVIGPALLYLAGTYLFHRPELARGWAIPCATDIAFSYLVARMIFKQGHPVIPFLLLLAIADDAAGLIILAVAYPTGEMNLPMFFGLVTAAILFNVFVLRKGLKINNFWPYLLIAGPVSWYGFFKGGIHPALALVPIIPTLPHQRLGQRDTFFEGTKEPKPGHSFDALNAFEHFWKNPVELILMLFGFANAGVVFSKMGLATGLVTGGLLIGKPLGITLFAWIAVKLLRLELPAGMNFKDVFTMGMLAAIGFTVALFVATVAFSGHDALDAAKMGTLFSFGAAILSLLTAWMLRVGRFAKAD